MDSNSTKLCRLCLQFSDDLVNIFDTFEDSTIASILAKHFWFQVNRNDSFTEWLCQICWIHTKTFHIYYKRMELCQRNYYGSTDLISADLIKQEQSVCPIEEGLEPDFDIVKCEETELTVQISKEHSSDYNDYIDYDESKIKQTSDDDDDDDQSSNKKPKKEDGGNVNAEKRQKPTPHIDQEHYMWHTRPDKDKQNAQIREFCTMKCDICSDVEFETLIKARQHYRHVHKISGYLMCCGKKFYKRHSILSHIVVHVNPDAYRCDQCGKYLTNKSALKAHIENHIPLDSRPNKCGLCSSSFRSRGILTRHVQIKHTSKNGETFPCDKCKKKFRSNVLLTCHKRHVHETTHKYVCEICARQFKTKGILRNHVQCKHSTTPRPKVQCNICGTWLTDDRGLQNHLKLHGRQQKDVVNCPICEKIYKDKTLLKNHIRYAHGEKQHQCITCDKAFMTANGLKEHIATHTGEDLYNCQYCEKKFKSHGNLSSHRKKAHLTELTRDFPERILKREISGIK